MSHTNLPLSEHSIFDSDHTLKDAANERFDCINVHYENTRIHQTDAQLADQPPRRPKEQIPSDWPNILETACAAMFSVERAGAVSSPGFERSGTCKCAKLG